MSMGNASKNPALGRTAELVEQQAQVEGKRWMRTSPVTNSGSPTTESAEMLMTLSSSEFSFSKPSTPRATARGIEMTRVTAPSRSGAQPLHHDGQNIGAGGIRTAPVSH